MYLLIHFLTDPPTVDDTTVSSSMTPADLSGFDITISWTVSIRVNVAAAMLIYI